VADALSRRHLAIALLLLAELDNDEDLKCIGRERSVCVSIVYLWFIFELVQELAAEDKGSFRDYRVEQEYFQELVAAVGPKIQKADTVMHTNIKPDNRVAVTLKFLATG